MTAKEVQAIMMQNLAMYRVGEKTFTEEQAATQLATWADALKDIPAQAGFVAMQRAFTVCRFPVTLADLFTQLRRMQSGQLPTSAEQWAELLKAAREAARDADRYWYTAETKSGKTQGQIARERNKSRFDALHPMARGFVGSLGGLVDLGNADDMALKYTRRDFDKAYCEYTDSLPLDAAILNRAALPVDNAPQLPGERRG